MGIRVSGIAFIAMHFNEVIETEAEVAIKSGRLYFMKRRRIAASEYLHVRRHISDGEIAA